MIGLEVGGMTGKKLLRFFVWYVLLPGSLVGWWVYCHF